MNVRVSCALGIIRYSLRTTHASCDGLASVADVMVTTGRSRSTSTSSPLLHNDGHRRQRFQHAIQQHPRVKHVHHRLHRQVRLDLGRQRRSPQRPALAACSTSAASTTSARASSRRSIAHQEQDGWTVSLRAGNLLQKILTSSTSSIPSWTTRGTSPSRARRLSTASTSSTTRSGPLGSAQPRPYPDRAHGAPDGIQGHHHHRQASG